VVVKGFISQTRDGRHGFSGLELCERMKKIETDLFSRPR
jgi:hypothetical protein